MNRKVQQTIEQHHMLQQGDKVIAAVSGGADSVALLHFLCFCTIPDLKVAVCHLNHGLRGAESDRDQQLVESMCKEYGLTLYMERVDAAKQAKAAGISIELAGRNLRYTFFQQLAEQHQAKIATAHTLSDTAETVLLNMTRGTGLEGLCGIPYRRGCVIRPLLDCSRMEIEDYCRQHNLTYHVDSTNSDVSYTRNYIRHRVIKPLLKVNQGALRNVSAMTKRLCHDRELLQQLAQKAWMDCAAANDGLLAEKVYALHPALRRRVLSRWLGQTGVEVNGLRIEKLEEMLTSPTLHTISLGETLQARLREGVLYVATITPRPRRRGLSRPKESKIGKKE